MINRLSAPPGLRASFALLLCVLLALGCSRARPIATLEKSAGKVERDFAKTTGTWAHAERGAKFELGDGVKTGNASTALLLLFDNSLIALDPTTLIRFLDRPSSAKGAKLDVVMGSATLEAGDAALDIDLSLGRARVDAHGKVRLAREGGTLKVEVMIGSAQMLGEKESLELRVGDRAEILPDRTLRSLPGEGAGAAASAAPPGVSSAGVVAPERGIADGGVDVDLSANSAPDGGAADAPARGPETVDFPAVAGDSFVVHDPKPPTAIAFTQNRCPSGALLTLHSARGKPRVTLGNARVSAVFPAGSTRYTLTCVGAEDVPVAAGTITVQADSGTRQLARTAPFTQVDADGRRYTVLYQSLLPKISVRWPNAPEASSYALSVRSSSGARSFTSAAPSYAFPASALAEGEHTLTFEAAGKRSKPTSVVVRFDNAAPTASIVSPADGSFAPGASVLLSGAALPGWSVSAAGKELAQDAQNRFSEEVGAPSGQRALVIRFSHPSRGVHYYLKRSVAK
jgi:hypothetical protein